MRKHRAKTERTTSEKDSWEAKMAEMKAQAREAATEAREAFNRNISNLKHKFD